MNRTAILVLAAIVLLMFAACGSQERETSAAQDSTAQVIQDLFAGVVAETPQRELGTMDDVAAHDPAPRVQDLGRFAGTFEFYGYEIVHIHNVESSLNAQDMAGDRIVVETGDDGRLHFSHIDVAMADHRWEAFRHAGGAGWPPDLVAWLVSDGFRFSPAGNSMEIMNTGGHANGLTSFFSMRLWYEDEDTIVYEEWRWRGTLWNEDAIAIEHREITFRLIYRRIHAFPVTVAMRVNDWEFSALAWEVDGQHTSASAISPTC